jgi:hypothetical protein
MAGRSRGGQVGRFRDTLVFSLVSVNIKAGAWKIARRERASWRSCLCRDAVSCEASKMAAAGLRRRKRRANEHEPLTLAAILCPHCLLPNTFVSTDQLDFLCRMK